MGRHQSAEAYAVPAPGEVKYFNTRGLFALIYENAFQALLRSKVARECQFRRTRFGEEFSEFISPMRKKSMRGFGIIIEQRRSAARCQAGNRMRLQKASFDAFSCDEKNKRSIGRDYLNSLFRSMRCGIYRWQ
jgi:hypothetical protein